MKTNKQKQHKNRDKKIRISFSGPNALGWKLLARGQRWLRGAGALERREILALRALLTEMQLHLESI